MSATADLEAQAKLLRELHQDAIVAMQAAFIEWRHGRGAEVAMEWITNTLRGPGLVPDPRAQYGREAQAWHDEHRSNPMPHCFCGRPSHIAANGHAYCCDEHAIAKQRH